MDLDSWLAFRAGETPREVKLTCVDCGGPAEGNVSCDEGEVCDRCHAEEMKCPLIGCPCVTGGTCQWGLNY